MGCHYDLLYFLLPSFSKLHGYLPLLCAEHSAFVLCCVALKTLVGPWPRRCVPSECFGCSSEGVELTKIILSYFLLLAAHADQSVHHLHCHALRSAQPATPLWNAKTNKAEYASCSAAQSCACMLCVQWLYASVLFVSSALALMCMCMCALACACACA